MPDPVYEGGDYMFGFVWGPMTVERTAVVNGRLVLTVKTDHTHVQIICSPQGRRLEVQKDA